MNVNIEATWKEVLQPEFDKPYFAQIRETLVKARAAGKVIFPPGPLIFNAFNSTPFDHVKVVILGQDPYHGDGEAMGLCFSVPKNVRIPPSLQNIYKELFSDLGLAPPGHGDLSQWAARGVLLLNASLTVERNAANSHKGIGWYTFTDAAIRLLSEKREHLVFMLWGNFAKQKKEIIDSEKHLVLEAAHPSPLAGGAFFGCRHFSKANEYLLSHRIDPVDWNLK